MFIALRMRSKASILISFFPLLKLFANSLKSSLWFLGLTSQDVLPEFLSRAGNKQNTITGLILWNSVAFSAFDGGEPSKSCRSFGVKHCKKEKSRPRVFIVQYKPLHATSHFAVSSAYCVKPFFVIYNLWCFGFCCFLYLPPLPFRILILKTPQSESNLI